MDGAWCWPQSVLGGEAVELFVSMAGPLRITVTRQGGEDTVVYQGRALGEAHRSEADVAISGCDWPATLAIATERTWSSGFYRVDVEGDGQQPVHAFFVVRAATRGNALLVLSTTTWAAYNEWVGPSFYTGGHTSSMRRPLPPGFLVKPDPHTWRIARLDEHDRDARRAFFARYSAWCMAAGWANQELLFARWAERQGIALDYAVSQDLHAQGGELLAGYPVYLSVGHDEYWSAQMRDAVEGYVEGGGNAAFFSGNTSFWQVRFEADDSRIVGYKLAIEDDPVFGTERQKMLSTMWSDPLVGRPENHMTGVSFCRGGYAHMLNSPYGSGGYSVWRPDHWAFEGLKLRAGDIVGDGPVVVGYECDGCELTLRDGLPVATGADGTPENFEVLGTAPAHLWETSEGLASGLPDHYIGELNWVAERLGGADTPENRSRFGTGRAVLGSFEKGSGQVLTTGCTDWAYGLGDPGIDTITRNVLNRFGAC